MSTHYNLKPVSRLKPGSVIALIATSSPVQQKEQLQAAKSWLSARGFAPRIMPSAQAKMQSPFGYLAGSPQMRTADLHNAFQDADVGAIWCLRGGFGAHGLLNKIDYSLLATHAKPFIGYSDVTAIHLAIQRFSGFITFHGPTLIPDLINNEFLETEKNVFDLLQVRLSNTDKITAPAGTHLVTLSKGTANGKLVGGNLAIIGSLIGTPYEIDTQNAILFLEDIGEAPQRVDRLLAQMQYAGKLSTLKGVLLGDFSVNDNSYDNQTRINKLYPIFQSYFKPLDIPILASWPSGHCQPNITLPLGANITLNADQGYLQIKQTLVV